MNMQTIEMIFTIGVILYAVILAVVGWLVSRKRNWKLGLVRIGVTVVAAVATLPLARMLSVMITDWVYGTVEAGLGANVQGAMQSVPVAVEGLKVLVALLAAPALYLTLFAIARGIGSVAVRILGNVIPAFRKKHNRALTWSLGAVNGLIIALVTLIPLCGFMALGGNCLDAIAQSGMMESKLAGDSVSALDALPGEGETGSEKLEAVAEHLKSNPVVVVVNGTVGRPAFTYLTSGELSLPESKAVQQSDALAVSRPAFGTLSATRGVPSVCLLFADVPPDERDPARQSIDMNLEREMLSLIDTAGSVVQAVDCIRAESFSEEDKNILYAAADSIFGSDSQWVGVLGTDTLNAFAESWLRGEAYLGLERPELAPELQPMMDCVLQVLASESTDTLAEDVHTVLDVVGDLLVYDVFAPGSDPSELIRKLGEDGMLTGALNKLRANPRMAVLATEVQSLGMRMVSKMLDVEKLKQGEHDEMLAKVAEECNKVLHMDPEERRETAAREMTKALSDNGCTVSEAVALEVADKLIADLGDDNEITAEELRNYLVDVAEGRVALPEGLETDIAF